MRLTVERKARHSSAIEEILLPEQAQRFAQVALRAEVYRSGLGVALLNGRLGNEVEIYENQRANLMDKFVAIEQRTKLEIERIRRQAELSMMNELSAEQRLQVDQALGKYFSYYEPTDFEKREALRADAAKRYQQFAPKK